MIKETHLCIRISSTQMNELIDIIIKNEIISKSEFVRQAIQDKISKLKQNENRRIKSKF